jgi:methionyl-tRNA synthetase
MTAPHTYITTTIPYVNARPHIGFALEVVQADVLARFRRQHGDGVRFQAGTDDNSLKNVLAAQAAGESVRAFVDRNAEAFLALGPALSLTVDDVIRTSRDARHRPGVERFWQACAAAGDLYRKRYEGLYCTGCEQFYSPAELRAGRCPEHDTEPQRVAEENWFFRLSRYGEALRAAITGGELRIEPAARRNEVLAFIDGGLEDFSVSRPAERAAGWGIPVPGDPGQVIYVWFDALCNYVTALGYGTGEDAYRQWWVSAGRRVHLLGKGVLRFHAVYWPAMLLSSGQPLPTDIVVHDYLTAGGRKISKSSGSGADPVALAAEYGADAVRWWLLREVPRVGDADFTIERMISRADDELANGLGNLVNRVVAMIGKYRGGRVPGPQPVAAGGEDLAAAIRHADTRIGTALEDFDFRPATAAIWVIADEANRFINRVRPWDLARAELAQAEAPRQLDAVLRLLFEACSALGRKLAPFLPDAAARITGQCTPGGDGRLPAAAPVFRRLAPGSQRRGGERGRSLAAAASLQAGEPEQEQQHEGADYRPDEADSVEAVHAHRVVLPQVLQEPADEGTHDAEQDGAQDADVVPAREQQTSNRADDQADDAQPDNEDNHAGKSSPGTRFMPIIRRVHVPGGSGTGA